MAALTVLGCSAGPTTSIQDAANARPEGGIDRRDATPDSEAPGLPLPDASAPDALVLPVPADAGVEPAAMEAGVAPADTAPLASDIVPPGTVSGVLHGVGPGGKATVILGNEKFLASQVVMGDGTYRFSNVPPGTYFLKVQSPGRTSGPARSIVVAATYDIRRVFTYALASGTDAGPQTAAGSVDFELGTLPADVFRYHWEEDQSPAGLEETAHVNTPPSIQFLDQPVTAPELAAADTLLSQFGVILSDEHAPWNQELAYRLLETLRSIPQPSRTSEGAATLVPSKWALTDQHVEDDIAVQYATGGTSVTIARDAFVYATPRLVLLDGQRGRFFSKRLHHALVRYVTRNGADLTAVEKILQDRFGCTTVVPDYAALTRPTTHEDSASFQPFHPEELIQLVDMFEEMPDGYHQVQGLKYLVRRKAGMPHPLYLEAPAVAWAWPDSFPGGSYIEFMDSGFNGDPDATHRLILHEKSHFLWGYVLSAAIKDEWTVLGGWHLDPADPDGWSTTKTTEFVSAYAHKKNPNEDLAESIAYFVLDPAALESRSPAKFAFIRDRLMQGTRYLSHIQEDLTFEVLNLFPDYTYPGKIMRVDVTAQGAPEADKVVTVELALHTADRVFAGASHALFRLYSPIGTYEDMYVYPVDQAGAVLRGQITISKYAKAGNWRPDQIVVTDKVGNQRLEGVNDYGWRLHIDNPLEDVTPPRYIPGSLTVERFDDSVTENGVPHAVQRVDVRWRYVEDHVMQRVYARLSNAAAVNVYPLESYGTFDAATSTALVTFYVTPFMTSGDYGVPFLSMQDAADNFGNQPFSSSPLHQPLVTLPIATTDPDVEAPHVSLNDDDAAGLHRILISAAPTDPTHPNGETLVKVSYQARDDKSGLGVVSYRLLDPQGLSHFEYHYHDNFYTRFFNGDPTAWASYEIHAVLPVGSPPGKWGLQELVVRDKAGNQRTLNFVETLQFMVGN
jgi:hypothetical protein